MNLGLALLTLFPGRAGGAETYVRGLLGAYAAGEGPELTTALVGRQNASSLQGFESPTVALAPISSYRPGNSSATRLLAMETARFKKRALARDLPPGLDLIHYPVTVPIPEIDELPKVVSLLISSTTTCRRCSLQPSAGFEAGPTIVQLQMPTR